MKIILPFFMIMLWPGLHISAAAQNSYSSFTSSKAKSISPDASSASVSYFKGIIKSERILLNWTIDKNQGADKFEVERSIDGKNFVMAALVFGTDQPDKVEYQFYEKNKKVKSFYRLKIISKDQTIVYSTIISPETFPAIN